LWAWEDIWSAVGSWTAWQTTHGPCMQLQLVNGFGAIDKELQFCRVKRGQRYRYCTGAL
jgi:hypothetical protein